LAEKARLTVLLAAGVGGAIVPCRGRVDRWGWAAARDFDSAECSACVDWDDGFDEEEENEADHSGEAAGQPRRYIAVRNGGGAAVRQIVFEIADTDDGDDTTEESEHVWPALLSPDGSGQAHGSRLHGKSELYSNDLCRLSVLELSSQSRAVRLRFETPGEPGARSHCRSSLSKRKRPW
jgi:hypothetical protein